MARELEVTSRDKRIVKIAVLPFEEIGKKDSPLGRQVQEELTLALVRNTKFTVLERSLVNKALNELAFQQTGAMDAASVRRLGAGVGAEAIVSGTVQKETDGSLRIIARLINTETFDILAVSASNDPQGRFAREQALPPARQEPTAPAPPPKFFDTYLDVFAGYTMPGTMDLNFGNEKNGVDSLYAGVPGTNTKYRLIEFRELAADGGVPFGLRLRGGSDILQISGEYLYMSYTAKSQSANVAFNGAAPQSMPISQDPLFTVRAHSMNLLLTVGYKLAFFEPYAGGAVGIGLYQLKSSSVYSYSFTSGVATFQPGLNALELGFSAAYLFGFRLHFTNTLGIFAEGRYTTALVNYSREINYETDQVAFRGYSFIAGVAVKM